MLACTLPIESEMMLAVPAVSYMDVFCHALPKGCHEKLLCQWNVLQAATPCFRIGNLNTGKPAGEPQRPRQRFGRSCYRLPRSGLVQSDIVPTPRTCRLSPKGTRLRAVWRGVPCLS